MIVTGAIAYVSNRRSGLFVSVVPTRDHHFSSVGLKKSVLMPRPVEEPKKPDIVEPTLGQSEAKYYTLLAVTASRGSKTLHV